MTGFSDDLSALVIKEMAASRGDSHRTSVVIECLARCLGFSIAIAARGEGRMIDELTEGATSYAHREAVEKAPVVHLMLRTQASGGRLSKESNR